MGLEKLAFTPKPRKSSSEPDLLLVLRQFNEHYFNTVVALWAELLDILISEGAPGWKLCAAELQ